VRLLALLTLLISASPALADEVDVPVDAVTNEGADPESLIRTAARRMKQGDLDGAELLLDQLDPGSIPVNLAVEADYQRANIRALARDYDQARQLYQGVIDDYPESHRELDARFRVAELTGVLGEPKAALKALRRLGRPRKMEPMDQAKIAFNRAIFTLEAGRERRGRRRFTRALRKHESGLVAYYEAKGWYTLIDAALDRIDDEPLRGSRRRMTRRLTERRQGMQQAEQAIGQAIELQEPEWVLAGLLRLAASYEDLGDDLLAAPEPDLTPAQLEIYRDELHTQVEQLWVRALAYLDGGADVAERLAWQSDRVRELEQRRARLMQRIEAGFPQG